MFGILADFIGPSDLGESMLQKSSVKDEFTSNQWDYDSSKLWFVFTNFKSSLYLTL